MDMGDGCGYTVDLLIGSFVRLAKVSNSVDSKSNLNSVSILIPILFKRNFQTNKQNDFGRLWARANVSGKKQQTLRACQSLKASTFLFHLHLLIPGHKNNQTELIFTFNFIVRSSTKNS